MSFIKESHEEFKRGDKFILSTGQKVILGGYSKLREGFNVYPLDHDEVVNGRRILHMLADLDDIRGWTVIKETC